MSTNNELDIETDFDDDIREAIYDAFSNAEGQCSPKYLRYELRKRGLYIEQLNDPKPNAKLDDEYAKDFAEDQDGLYR